MIINYSHLEVKPGHEEEFLEACKLVLKGARANEGNINYNLVKVFGEENTYKAVGFWRDAEVYDAHLASDYVADYMKKSTEFLSAPITKEVIRGENR
ncbi:MAG: antibiotic biosynthesis monooxygenase [Planococcus sp. (in: firmicutes)]